MNIILNFIPLKSGGGVQVGLDFISNIPSLGHRHQWYLVATEGTPFVHSLETENLKIIKIVPDNLLMRIYFELIACNDLINKYNIDVAYTQFGPHWIGSSIPNVVGCAYSNLLYPEIKFWNKLSYFNRCKKIFIDYFRKIRMKNADVVIFETEELLNRFRSLYRFDHAKSFCVKPSVSSIVLDGLSDEKTKMRFENLPKKFRVLLLSGYHPNKNIELLLEISKILKWTHHFNNVVFITTLPHHNKNVIDFFDTAKQNDVLDMIYNVGPIPHHSCADIYKSCDAVILPSQLESFSNNIAESWAMSKPLIISDMSWSRSLCGNGALYYNYCDPIDAANKIIKLVSDTALYDILVENGHNTLKFYPTSQEKFQKYLEILERFEK